MAFLVLGSLEVKVTEMRRLPDERGGGGLRRTVNGHLRGAFDWVKRGWSGEIYAADDAELAAVMAQMDPDRAITVSGDALSGGDYLMESFGAIPPGLDSTTGVSIVSVPGTAGGTAMQVAGGYRVWYPDLARAVPFNPSTLYQLEARIRVTQDGGGEQNERIYAGVHALDAAGARISLAGVGVNRYIVANAVRPVETDGWVTYTGWLRGTGAHSTSPTESNPAGLQDAEHAIWISPLLGIHWAAPGTNQVTQVDYFRIAASDPSAAALGIVARAEVTGDIVYVRTGADWFYRVPITLREV